MNRSIHAIRPCTRSVTLALLGGLVIIAMTAVLIGPVHADGRDHRDWQRHGEDRGRGPPRYDGPRYQGYYRQPDMYYSAPPVVYQPPGASLNFSFPMFR